ncbi:MAG: DUF3035 domain-containing protein [Parvularculaceae bacterium]
MNNRKILVRVGLSLVMLAAASGCAGIGKAIGGGKNPPDEFAIATKAPLVVPPDYAMRPPKPGETRPQEMSPSERAQQVLMGDTAAAPPSDGEQVLLQKAGALGVDPSIRAVLDAENGGRVEKDRSFANQLMFWKFDNDKVDDSGAPLRVDDPAAWFEGRETAIARVTGEDARVTIKNTDAQQLPGVY